MEGMLVPPPAEINFKFIPTHFHSMKTEQRPHKTEGKMQIRKYIK